MRPTVRAGNFVGMYAIKIKQNFVLLYVLFIVVFVLANCDQAYGKSRGSWPNNLSTPDVKYDVWRNVVL
jgi:hypothetical protein